MVGEVEDRDCLIVDDMIDTAGTMAQAIQALKQLGARNVYAAATHPLLSGPAIERLREAQATEIAVTNTIAIPNDRSFDGLKVLSIAPLFSQAIHNTHSDQSISSLFD